MKFSLSTVAALLLADHCNAFTASSFGFAGQQQQKTYSSSFSSRNTGTILSMAVDMPPATTATPTPTSREIVIPRKQNTEVPVLEANSYGQPTDVRYSDFIKLIRADRVEKVKFSDDGTQLLGIDVDGTRFKIGFLPNDPTLLKDLTDHSVDITVLQKKEASGIGDLLGSLVFPALLFVGLFFLSRRARSGGDSPGGPGGLGGGMGGPGGAMGFAKAKSQIQMVPDTGVTFDDVAGCDQAKLELAEVVDFMKKPEIYTRNGARIPRGVILDGPPGTGKTMLAKAVAGEAGVPFISASGSEFVEMFIGVGAARVRDIFGTAKKNAPCIIFIDEIDAVGRQRGSGMAGGNDEREQTVNQMLVEMDGFDGNPGIIVIAATNRIDILDKALIRPGRFDRKITVSLPDFKGRTRILGVHARGKPLEPDVDLEAVSRRTPGYSGAQLKNLLNEAAIMAARRKKTTIGWSEVDDAVDRLMVGLEKQGGTTPRKQVLVAYHEAGHAIVGACVPDYDQVQKITIVPRSNGAGGLTFFTPNEGRLEAGFFSRQYLESQLAVALGGRVSEELIYGIEGMTTGASNDFEQVASIAKRMVTEYGMSDKVGNIALSGGGGGGPNMGGSMTSRGATWGSDMVALVNEEVERLVNNSYLVAKKILTDNRELLEHLKDKLMEQETVSAEEFQMMLVEFKTRTIDYGVLGDELNRDKLPFYEPAEIAA